MKKEDYAKGLSMMSDAVDQSRRLGLRTDQWI